MPFKSREKTSSGCCLLAHLLALEERAYAQSSHSAPVWGALAPWIWSSLGLSGPHRIVRIHLVGVIVEASFVAGALVAARVALARLGSGLEWEWSISVSLKMPH